MTGEVDESVGRRWQYRVVNLGVVDTVSRMLSALGALGAEGWELVATMDKASNWFSGAEKGFLLFKREVPPGAPEPTDGWAAAFSPAATPSGVSGWEQLGADLG
ncbi:MAG: hypothetical protein JWN67_4024 [Actinomycetia bacterium]|nr:hypothetical protein [Actinomycetes bacterium]